MRPDLFAGIIAEVPFVDVLNTMLDDTLPLTPPEWPEWGNPISDAEAFRTILSYSPYDNVRAQDYPAMLALAGLTDPRVTYWEPAKWVARLRAPRTDDNLIAFRTNMDAGHGGAPGRFDRLKEVALSLCVRDRGRGRADSLGSALLEQIGLQLVDRREPHRALRQLGLDRAVDVERIGHAVDHARLVDRARRRRSARGARRLRECDGRGGGGGTGGNRPARAAAPAARQRREIAAASTPVVLSRGCGQACCASHGRRAARAAAAEPAEHRGPRPARLAGAAGGGRTGRGAGSSRPTPRSAAAAAAGFPAARRSG